MNYHYRNHILIPLLILLAMIAGALLGRGMDLLNGIPM